MANEEVIKKLVNEIVDKLSDLNPVEAFGIIKVVKLHFEMLHLKNCYSHKEKVNDGTSNPE